MIGDSIFTLTASLLGISYLLGLGLIMVDVILVITAVVLMFNFALSGVGSGLGAEERSGATIKADLVDGVETASPISIDLSGELGRGVAGPELAICEGELALLVLTVLGWISNGEIEDSKPLPSGELGRAVCWPVCAAGRGELAWAVRKL